MSTRDLLAAIASNRPGEVWDQIAVRRELCRRIKGRVAAAFAFQPICLRDATYDWSAVTWSPQTLEQIAARKRAQVLKPGHFSVGDACKVLADSERLRSDHRREHSRLVVEALMSAFHPLRT
jgi:hypothetical protein